MSFFSKLHFHPNITRYAMALSGLSGFSGVLALLGAANKQMQDLFGDHRGAQIAAGCILLSIVLTQIAGLGHSPINSPPAAKASP